jgi:hypothetical protein
LIEDVEEYAFWDALALNFEEVSCILSERLGEYKEFDVFKDDELPAAVECLAGPWQVIRDIQHNIGRRLRHPVGKVK